MSPEILSEICIHLSDGGRATSPTTVCPDIGCDALRSRRGDQVVANSVPNTQPNSSLEETSLLYRTPVLGQTLQLAFHVIGRKISFSSISRKHSAAVKHLVFLDSVSGQERHRMLILCCTSVRQRIDADCLAGANGADRRALDRKSHPRLTFRRGTVGAWRFAPMSQQTGNQQQRKEHAPLSRSQHCDNSH